MANTSRGIWYPGTSNTVQPASRDFRDLALTTDAAITAASERLLEIRREPITLPDGIDLDDVTRPDWYRVRWRATWAENRPQGFNSPFEVHVASIGEQSGIVWLRQTVIMPDPSREAARRVVRYGQKPDGQPATFGNWHMEHGATPLLANEDLNDYLWPTTVEATTWSIANSIANRPDAFSDRFIVYVSRAATITFQIGIGWAAYGVVIAARSAVNGNFSPWNVLNGPEADLTTVDRTQVTAFGDSHIDGNPVTEAIQVTLGNNVTVTNGGRGGDTVDHVLMRAGVRELWFSIPTGQIPASGSVTVETPVLMDSGRDRTFTGTLSGVPGTLQFTAADRSWQFTRSTSGTAVTVSGTAHFIPTQSGAAYDTLIVWMGENNEWDQGGKIERATTLDHIKAAYQQFIQSAGPQRRVLAVGMTYSKNLGPGDPKFDLVADLNTWLATVYPNNYAGLNEWLIEHGMEAAGLSDTQDDIEARAAGRMPPSLFEDNIHFKPSVRTAIGDRLATLLQQRGWA